MNWREEVRNRVAGLNLGPAHEKEIVEEVSQHLQSRFDELRAGGSSEADAFQTALSELDVPPLAEQLAQQLAPIEPRGEPQPIAIGTAAGNVAETVWQDARYAARTFRRSPGFAAVVIVTLALGIGATTAIFTVLDGVMLRPLPYPDVDRVFELREITRAGEPMSISWPNFQDWRAQNHVFEHLGVYRPAVVNLTGGDQPQRLAASLVSSDVFDALGIRPLLGRTFLASEDLAGTERVAIVSERLWRSAFGAGPSLVGRTLALNGRTHVVVGIMPAAMRFPSRLTDVWLPLGLYVSTFPQDRGAHPGLYGVGKLKVGVSSAQANAEMDTIARRLEQQYPLPNANHGISLTSYYEEVVQNVRPALLVLIAAVGFLLLIACANLANLMLAKADGRQREIAVRVALGADRRRIVQQLLTESLLLAIAGGAIGVLIAFLGVRAFVASRPTSIPRIDLIAVDRRVMIFSAVVSIVTGILFGLLPALRASSTNLLTSLKQASQGAIGVGSRVRSSLVVVEVGLALVLLVGAGLTLRSFGHLISIDPGFKAERVMTLRLTLPDATYPSREAWISFHRELLRRVSTLPGIDAVGLNSAVPLEGGGSESEVIAEGRPLPTHDQDATMCLFQAASPDYFSAMGIQLLEGRSFTDADSATSALVAVVDESLARKLFPDVDPIGRRIAFEFHGHSPADAQPIWREIVGVVRHVRHYGLTTEPPHVQVYAPFVQLPLWFEQRRPSMALVARTAVEPETFAGSIRRQVAFLDRDIPVYGIQTMQSYIEQTTEVPRLSMILLGSFGTIALVLVVVGIYGVLSYLVSQRRQEIGVRMALGATSGDVLRLIVGHAMALTALGLAIGMAASWALTRSLQALLFDISPHDPATFASIAMLVAAVALAASYLPGRRATEVDPVIALRQD